MSARLHEWLAREGVMAPMALEAAVARQRIYGGGLDTAILERGALTEPALWARLAAATGLPVPGPAIFENAEVVEAPPALDRETTGSLRVVPVGRDGDTVLLLCAEPIAEDRIRAVTAAQGLAVRLFVVPETRLWAMRQRIYGEPLPARYAPLLAAALGARRARLGSGSSRAEEPSTATPAESAWSDRGNGGVPTPLERFFDLSAGLALNPPRQQDGEETGLDAEVEVEVLTAIPEVVSESVRLEVVSSTPAAATIGPDGGWDNGGDSATDSLCRRARNPDDKGGVLALRALRQRLTHPATLSLMKDLRASLEVASPASQEAEADTVHAIEALSELRDHTVIPLLIERLGARGAPPIATAAHRALVSLCAQDFGQSRRRWQTWARAHADQPRVEWVLEGLAHKNRAIRGATAEELRHLTGDSFGFDPDGPKRERERGRRLFVAWWQKISRPRRTPSDRGDAFLGPAGEVPLPPAPKAR